MAWAGRLAMETRNFHSQAREGPWRKADKGQPSANPPVSQPPATLPQKIISSVDQDFDFRDATPDVSVFPNWKTENRRASGVSRLCSNTLIAYN